MHLTMLLFFKVRANQAALTTYCTQNYYQPASLEKNAFETPFQKT